MSSCRRSTSALVVASVLFLVLAAWFYHPVFLGKTQIHGDGIVHGYAFYDYLRHVLYGKASLLWTDNMYGGHPIFAESQGGFVNPFNVIVALIFPSAIGHNIFHLLCIWLGALGAYGWLRIQRLSNLSSVFGALALAFSGGWLSVQQNLSISAALLWMPWVFLSYEYFMQKLSWRSAAALSLTTALMMTAGYPQVLHATAIYIAVNLLFRFFADSDWRLADGKTVRLVSLGVVASVFFLLLSAVQLLPLIELTINSHRAEGVAIWEIAPAAIIRGLILHPVSSYSEAFHFQPSVGSALISALALIALFLPGRKFVFSHLLPTLLLIALSFGKGPVYELASNYHLIPGLQFFRTTTMYALVAVAGIAVLAASAVEQLARATEIMVQPRWRWLAVGLLCTATPIALILYLGPLQAIPLSLLFTPLLGCAGAAILWAASRSRWVAPFLLCLLIGEILATRISMFGFYDVHLLDEPPSVAVLAQRDELRDYKLFDNTVLMAYAFKPSKDPTLVDHMAAMKAAISPSTNLLWDLSSIQGATALPLRRRMLIEKRLNEEISGAIAVSPGVRFIDLLGVRFISSIKAPGGEGFDPLYSQPAFSIYDNRFALPRVRAYSQAIMVEDERQAYDVIASMRSDQLVVETDGKSVSKIDHNSLARPMPMDFSVQAERSDFYQIETDFTEPGWLFIADANYPGWRAYVDGEEVEVYSADVLGKAVYVDRGTRQVVVTYDSQSFQLGLALSAIGLAVVLIIVLLPLVRNRGTSTANSDDTREW